MSVYGIPDDELAIQQKEAYESEGKAQCPSCMELKPIDELTAHAGECQECWETTGSPDASDIEWMNAPMGPRKEVQP